jgi:hypothetical protein
LIGNNGLQAQINDNTATSVTNNSSTAESRYPARFYFDPNTITMGKNDAHFIFQGLNAAGTVVSQVELRRNGSNYQISASCSVIFNCTVDKRRPKEYYLAQEETHEAE